MKTGIITLVGNNYGNRLQNYAVQELLTKYGDVYTVQCEKKMLNTVKKKRNSHFTFSYIKEAVDSRLLNIYHISNRKRSFVSRLYYFLKHKNDIKMAIVQRDEAFRKFDEKYICYEKEVLHLSGDEAEAWVKSYSAWVCGSDQIWNPNYPTATRNAFLQFAPEQRRIAMCASIGVSDINAMLPEYSEWISSIPYLSVREKRAAEIVEELTGRKTEVFLDPTMLIPLEKWEQLAESVVTNLPDKFAVGYFLGIREKAYMDYIEKQTAGMEYVDLLNGESLRYMTFGPEHVVEAIRKAEMVFVDSFHGAVFSILFHKEFIVFERSEQGQTMNCRLQTLLQRFGLEDRVFNTQNQEQLHKPIDYTKVDAILAEERLRARGFLDYAMKEIAELPMDTVSPIKHIQITRPEKCSGCTACANVCPKNCIIMKSDEEGFCYPEINEYECVNCGKCTEVCPLLHYDGCNAPERVLAEKNKNESIRSTSSSGGVFYELAKMFLQTGGLVYGCALDEDMVARHVCVDSIEGLERLKGSKYVQSDMGNIMFEIKRQLIAGKKVLFSGTPCQAAGLRSFLGRDYEKLLIIDTLCHGVPSPKLFADYLDYLSKQYDGAKVISVNFRNKQRGWKRLYMEVCFDNGKRHYIYSGFDRYEGMFLNNLSLRPACYECKFAKKERFGDITLGDFWGIGKRYPQWDDDKGISVVMLNNVNAITAYKKVEEQFEGREESFETARAGQRTLYAPTLKNPNRDAFYKMYVEKGCEEALEHYTYVPSPFVRAYYTVMRWSLDIIRKLLRTGY